MAEVSTDDIKKLRDISGAGMMDCKKALAENGGDIEKAAEFLRKKGIAKAGKRMDRATGVGRVFSYIHGAGGIGVLLQLNCETDFVAKNDKFEELGKELCMQIAASAPLAATVDEMPAEEVERERGILREQLVNEGKKAAQIDKILEGKIKKFLSENVLLEQPYIKEPKQTIQDVLKEYISQFGENITVARFARYQVG